MRDPLNHARVAGYWGQALRRAANVVRTADFKRCMADRSRTVLHVSPDSALTESRTRVPGDIGCEVCSVQTVVAALFEISFGQCGILRPSSAEAEGASKSLNSFYD